MNRSPESIAEDIISRFCPSGTFNRPLAQAISLNIRRELSEGQLWILNMIVHRIEIITHDPDENDITRSAKLQELNRLAETIRKTLGREFAKILPIRNS